MLETPENIVRKMKKRLGYDEGSEFLPSDRHLFNAFREQLTFALEYQNVKESLARILGWGNPPETPDTVSNMISQIRHRVEFYTEAERFNLTNMNLVEVLSESKKFQQLKKLLTD